MHVKGLMSCNKVTGRRKNKPARAGRIGECQTVQTVNLLTRDNA